MSAEKRLSRRKLYGMVWETPITRLAKELGFSDVGLRKVCLRHDVPLPARGHWARVAAGQTIQRPKLPRPDEDEPIHLQPLGPRKSRPTSSKASNPEAISVVVTPIEPVKRHALVAATAEYFDKVQAELDRRSRLTKTRGAPHWTVGADTFHFVRDRSGRIDSSGEGRLRVVATMRHIEWILSFHDRLLSALAAQGCVVEVEKTDKTYTATVTGHGGSLAMWFTEDFDKHVQKTAGSIFREVEYRPKDTYQLRYLASRMSSPKIWRGTQQRLDASAGVIAAAVVDLLEADRVWRAKVEADRLAREQREAEMKIWRAEQEIIRKRKEARRAQVGRLFQAASGHDEYLWAAKRLAEIEAAAPDDEAVRVWVGVVRENLADPHAALIAAIRAEAAKEERPLWWPDPPADP